MPRIFTMPNTRMLICSTLAASAMVVPLLLLENTVDGFPCAEFRIVECFPRCAIHCMNVVCFPVLMCRLNAQVNNMWRNRKTFLKWYSVALLLARENFLHVFVFHDHVYGEHCMMAASTHFPHSVCKFCAQGTVPCV
jgi:hypothetical protein